jgi:hypothetical protein
VELERKLQLKPGQSVSALCVPPDVDLGLTGTVATDAAPGADAVLVFVQRSSELDELAGPVVDAADRGALAWVAYPKGGQRGTDLNRDRLAQLLVERGLDTVRQVAIDDTWSALRFKPAFREHRA